MDRALNRPICKDDDITRGVSVERSGICRRHVQRSRGLQLVRAVRAGVNTEERAGDGRRPLLLQRCVYSRTVAAVQADGGVGEVSHRRGIRRKHRARSPWWTAEPRRAAAFLCLTWTPEREPLFLNFLQTFPEARESSRYSDCLVVTEGVFEQHKQGICRAVLQVQNQLDSPNEIEQSVADLQLSDPPKPPAGSPKPSHHVKTGPPPKQETAGGLTSKERKTQLYQDWQQQFQPIESSPAAPAPFAANREPSLQPCVANPVQVTPSSLPSRPQNPGSKQAQPLKTPQSTPQYHRWNSTPVEVPRTGGAFGNVTMSHVNGVQIGNNNVMNISHHPAPGAQRQRQRHRNPTAPSSVQLPTEQPARSKDQL